MLIVISGFCAMVLKLESTRTINIRELISNNLDMGFSRLMLLGSVFMK